MATGQLISADYLRQILHYDPETGAWTWRVSRRGKFRVGFVAGTFTYQGYREIKLDGHKYRAHRLAWLYMTGAWPKAQIDHVNLDKADNRWSNLRQATNAQNKANVRAPVTNKSGAKGVHWHKRRCKWQAGIEVSGRRHHLGRFATLEAARTAYSEAAEYHFGQFARAA